MARNKIRKRLLSAAVSLTYLSANSKWIKIKNQIRIAKILKAKLSLLSRQYLSSR